MRETKVGNNREDSSRNNKFKRGVQNSKRVVGMKLDLPSVEFFLDNLNWYFVICYLFQSDCSCSWNDLTQFHCNLCLTGFVVFQSQRSQDLAGVLGSVLHSVHTRALFTGDVIEHGVVKDGGDVEIIEKVRMLSHTLRVVFGDKLEGLHEFLSTHNFHFSLELANHILELVEHQ